MGSILDVSAMFADAKRAAREELAIARKRSFITPIAGPYDLGFSALQQTVNEPYRQHGVVYRALAATATAASRFESEVYLDGSKDPVDEHWLPEVLAKPDQFRRAAQLLYAMSLHWDAWGEVHLWHMDIRRGGPGLPNRPHQLWLLDPRQMMPVEKGTDVVAWRWTGPYGAKTIPAAEHTYIRAENPYHPIRGLGALAAALIEYAADYRAALWNRAFLDNNAVPPLVFHAKDPSTPWPDDERTEFIESWVAKQSGPLKRGIPSALPPGVGVEMLKTTAAEMEFLGGRVFSREQILMILGVPPAIAGVPSSGSGNYQNYGQQRKQFHFDRVLPLVEMFAASLTADVLQRYEPGAKFRFCTDAVTAEILADEFAEKVKTAQALWGMGVPVAQINERLGLGLDTKGMPWLDEGWLPFSVVNAGRALEDAAEPTEPAPDDEPEAEADEATKRVRGASARAILWRRYERQMAHYERRYLADWRRFLAKLRDATLDRLDSTKTALPRNVAALVRAPGDIVPPDPDVEKLAATQMDQAAKLAVSEAWKRLLAELELEVTFDFNSPAVLKVLAERTISIKGAADTVAEKLRGSIGEGIASGESPQDLARRVKDLIAEQYRGQARTVARTESAAAFSRSRHEAMAENGVDRHEWVSAHDDKVRESHVACDGQVRVFGEEFPNGLSEPHQNDADPAEVINCRCVAVPVVD